MPLPRSPAGASEINRGCHPPEYATPHPALSCTPAGCRPSLSLSVFSPRLLLRPSGAQRKGGRRSLAGGYTPGYQPHAPPGGVPPSSLYEVQTALYLTFNLTPGLLSASQILCLHAAMRGKCLICHAYSLRRSASPRTLGPAQAVWKAVQRTLP